MRQVYRHLLLWSCLFFLVGCHSKAEKKLPPVSVTGFRVQAQTIPAKFQFVGVAKSSHPVEIRSRVEGYLQSIDYIEGGQVAAGSLLFRIDPAQFEAKLEEAKGELARREAILWRSQRSLERLEPLYEQHAASERDRDNALASVLANQAAIIEAKANIEQAELNLSYTYITSPIQGLTGRARFREGTLITPSINGLLTEVSVINPIWVVFSVSDKELLQGAAKGKASQLILPKEQYYTVVLQLADGSLFPYTGRVNFTSPTLDASTSSLVVRAQFPNPNGTILPGQFVQAIVLGAYRPNAIVVPQESVVQGEKGMYVFVINDDNTVSIRAIEVGVWYNNYWIINQGLNSGDVVVAQGTNKVVNGSKVRVIEIDDI